LAAKASYLGRVYLDWAKFPITETESTPDGDYIVYFHDLRFGSSPSAGGSECKSCTSNRPSPRVTRRPAIFVRWHAREQTITLVAESTGTRDTSMSVAKPYRLSNA
jgi:hypothetical protein